MMGDNRDNRATVAFGVRFQSAILWVRRWPFGCTGNRCSVFRVLSVLEACIESVRKLTGYSWHARLIQLFHFVCHRHGLGGSDGVTTSIAGVHGA